MCHGDFFCCCELFKDYESLQEFGMDSYQSFKSHYGNYKNENELEKTIYNIYNEYKFNNVIFTNIICLLSMINLNISFRKITFAFKYVKLPKTKNQRFFELALFMRSADAIKNSYFFDYVFLAFFDKFKMICNKQQLTNYINDEISNIQLLLSKEQKLKSKCKELLKILDYYIDEIKDIKFDDELLYCLKIRYIKSCPDSWDVGKLLKE